MSRHRPRTDQRANLGGKGFAAIPHVVMESCAWRSLSLRGRAVLLEIVRRHNGYNNGQIGASLRDLASATGSTNYAATGAAIVELIGHGLLDIEAAGERWARKAREYRVTWLPTGEPPHRKPATDDWRAFLSDTTASSAEAIPDTTASAARRSFDTTASARVREKRRKTAIPSFQP